MDLLRRTHELVQAVVDLRPHADLRPNGLDVFPGVSPAVHSNGHEDGGENVFGESALADAVKKDHSRLGVIGLGFGLTGLSGELMVLLHSCGAS